MALTIIRSDITLMQTDAIVNTASAEPAVGPGCDTAVYRAAGYDRLLAYRREHVGTVPEGEVFLTPGFDLPARYIIHAVSPLYRGGDAGEEEKLRACYRKSLALADARGMRSLAFPLIATGSFGYPKEEGLRIAADEINAFLLRHDMQVFLVVFGEESVKLGRKIAPHLEAYIDRHYEAVKYREEYGTARENGLRPLPAMSAGMPASAAMPAQKRKKPLFPRKSKDTEAAPGFPAEPLSFEPPACDSFEEEHESRLQERLRHRSDSFSQYLLYLIREKRMDNAEVYKRAIVDKKVFSKLKNNPDYHPQKITALCLCVGARLNLDETRDLLARAGYALSPSDKTDIIFSYFIENGIYDMIELDIQLEEHGLPCLIE